MQHSETRILTTHAGSLPRSRALIDLHVRRSRQEPVDPAAFAAAIEQSTAHVVARQLASGIDVGNGGEQSAGGRYAGGPVRRWEHQNTGWPCSGLPEAPAQLTGSPAHRHTGVPAHRLTGVPAHQS